MHVAWITSDCISNYYHPSLCQWCIIIWFVTCWFILIFAVKTSKCPFCGHVFIRILTLNFSVQSNMICFKIQMFISFSLWTRTCCHACCMNHIWLHQQLLLYLTVSVIYHYMITCVIIVPHCTSCIYSIDHFDRNVKYLIFVICQIRSVVRSKWFFYSKSFFYFTLSQFSSDCFY